MKNAAVTELEHVLTQIAKLLKEAKATFRKNRLAFRSVCYLGRTTNDFNRYLRWICFHFAQ